MKQIFAVIAVSISLAGVASASPTSGSANFNLLSGETGAGGGLVTGGPVSGPGSITASVSVGDAVSGGVSDVTTGNVQAKGGYVGQLYDAVDIVLSADPGTSLNEGDAVQLSAMVTMDDETTLKTSSSVGWSVLSGPIESIDGSGLAIAGTTTADSPAQVQGVFDTLSANLDLTVLNLPYVPNPLTWEGGDGPYRVLFGTNAGALTEVGTPTRNFFDPGQLDMGTTYFWQVFDASNNDITPGGTGPASFATALYQADAKIGRSSSPLAHRGNDLYNLSGAGQVQSITTKGTRTGRIHFSVENDGSVADTHGLRMPRPSRKFKYVRYYSLSDGRGNITAAAMRAAYGSLEKAPGEGSLYQIRAKGNGKKKARQTVRISTSSASDARGADAATGRILAKPKKKKKKKR